MSEENWKRGTKPALIRIRRIIALGEELVKVAQDDAKMKIEALNTAMEAKNKFADMKKEKDTRQKEKVSKEELEKIRDKTLKRNLARVDELKQKLREAKAKGRNDK